MEKCVVPISGGLDSTVILHLAKSKGFSVHAVSFNYGQKHLLQELLCAQKQTKDITDSYKILDLSFFKDIVTTSLLLITI